MLRGSCLCQGVAFEIDGVIKDPLYCHCTMCRKAHGSAFRARGKVLARAFRWLRGAELVRYYESSPGSHRGFCSVCGSNLISKFDAKPSVYGLALGVLDDDPQVRPVCHLYVGSKAPWFEITDSLPQYETLPPGVDKAEEPGNDASTAAPPGIMPVVIRAERPDDAAAIDEVTRQAFASHPHSRQTEQFIVRALRAAGALAVSLVAERSGRVVGHIAFSPVALSDASVGWFGMGPVSVLPSAQRQGIGRSLIEHGLSLLRERGAAGCVLVGEPSFYSRFGFAEHPGLLLPGVPQEFFLALPFGPALPQGEVTFHAAFSAER